ncbi:hypothetical protein ACTXT7_009691 [Hymenolepis weldensis]
MKLKIKWVMICFIETSDLPKANRKQQPLASGKTRSWVGQAHVGQLGNERKGKGGRSRKRNWKERRRRRYQVEQPGLRGTVSILVG